MSEFVNAALDAMGGDYAPYETVRGAVEAVKLKDNINVHLVGKSEVISEELSKYTYPEGRIKIVQAAEVIETGEAPVMAVRHKKDSSIVVGLNLVKNGECDSFVSAGSSGAVLVGAQGIVGRIKGIERPPLAPVIPTAKGPALLVDSGANVDARPSHLIQFAAMGSIYMEYVMGIKSPRVGILNIGQEEEKGNQLVKETFPLLKELEGINFIGSVEARDIVEGVADVIVCEGFAGNIALKMYEGVGSLLLREIKGAIYSSAAGKLGGLLIKNNLKTALKKYDISEYGGAPLLGLKGLVVKTHGNSKYEEIRNSIIQCITFKENDINGKIKEGLKL